MEVYEGCTVSLAYKDRAPLFLAKWQIENLGRHAGAIARAYASQEPFRFILGAWVWVKWDDINYPGIHLRHASGNPGVYVLPDSWNKLMKELDAAIRSE